MLIIPNCVGLILESVFNFFLLNFYILHIKNIRTIFLNNFQTLNTDSKKKDLFNGDSRKYFYIF